VEACVIFSSGILKGSFVTPNPRKSRIWRVRPGHCRRKRRRSRRFIAAHQAGRHAPDAKRQRDELLSKSAYRWKSPFTFPRGASGISVTGSKEGLSIRLWRGEVDRSGECRCQTTTCSCRYGGLWGLFARDIRHEPNPLRHDSES
jgi:hypothetical protein